MGTTCHRSKANTLPLLAVFRLLQLLLAYSVLGNENITQLWTITNTTFVPKIPCSYHQQLQRNAIFWPIGTCFSLQIVPHFPHYCTGTKQR